MVSTNCNGKLVESLILTQNYMHDISSVDLLDEKDQIATLLVVGNSSVDSIHLIDFGTINSKFCLLRDSTVLNCPVRVT